jgi:mannobiose 2-epimerase
MNCNLNQCLEGITNELENGIIPFWLKNGIDKEYGGYLTNFDENGIPTGDTNKYIVTQTRMIWGFSALYQMYRKEEYKQAAREGVEFFIRNFWDKKFGGWFWKTTRDGILLDNGKVVYGQTFAIYALSKYTLATGEQIGLQYACSTFDLLQKYCADIENGGYNENLERDWTLSPSGFSGGDLKSLDVHMHTMEAYTTLFQCSRLEIHRKILNEIIHLLLKRMINNKIGCGYNQFDIYFNRRPAINIRRTWNSERKAGEVIKTPMDTTSYGHNIEFVWMLNRACNVLNEPYHKYDDISRKIVDHTLKYGFDYKRGGVFRDGPHEGEPLVKDKEWWQNCEALIGFLDAYEHLGDEKYAEAFAKTWDFDKTYLINEKIGEWRQLVTYDGKPIISDIGNPWKAIYHTGRSMMECKQRLEKILRK